MKVEVVAHRSCTTIGEGPFWEEATQCVKYVDIVAGSVHQYNSNTGVDTKFPIGGTVSFVVPRASGGYIIGHNNTLAHYDLASEKLTKLHQVEEDKRNQFNDGKCDRSGRLYAGTMPTNVDPQAPQDLPVRDASLYSLETDGSLHKRVDVVDLSNGLAWSADNKTMFYVDSMPRTIYAFDYDEASGTLTRQRVVKAYGGEETMQSLGFPDGMCIDTDDKLWVANFSASKVIRWDPVTGEQLLTVPIPGASRITSCAFGGPHLDELYVTSCAFNMTPEQLKQEPNAGSLFKVTGLGVKGTPGIKYAG